MELGPSFGSVLGAARLCLYGSDHNLVEAKAQEEPMMEIEQAPLDDLVPDPENSRVHPEENIQAIQDSLDQFGQVLPLVVHKASRIVVGGNGTIKAMRRLGWDVADVTIFDGSMEDARALSVALNRTAELAEWDEEALGSALVSLQEHGYTHDKLGFSAKDLDVMFPVSSGEGFRPDTGGDFKPESEGEPKSPGLGTPVVRYDLIFDDEAQQKTFFKFLKHLKGFYNEEPTVAARLDKHIQDFLGAAS